MSFVNDQNEKVSVQCQDNSHGYGEVVFGDETFALTSSCIPDMAGYRQYISRCRNQFSSGVITAENWNDAQASCGDSHPTRCSHGRSFEEEEESTSEGDIGIGMHKKYFPNAE